MDAPPNGPEEGLISPSDENLQSRPDLLLTSLELLGSPAGTVELDVTGTSMLPTLTPGDRIRVQLDRERRRFGDVIVFVQGDSVVVHRYLGPASDRVGRRCLRSRGDGRRELDPPLFPENLIGRVRAVRRGGTWRRLDGAPARGYGAALAAHDLFWAGAVHLANLGGFPRLSQAAAALDRVLLACVDAAVFRWLHPAAPGPEHAKDPGPH